MKKVILKSILYAICIGILSLFLFIVISISFFPAFVSDQALFFGNKKLCVKYSEKAYIKNNDISSLATLVDRCIWAENNQKIIKYGDMLITDKDYVSFSASKDQDYSDWIAANVAIALYQTGDITYSVDYAILHTEDFSLTASSPIKYLCAIVSHANDNSTMELIIDSLNKLDDEAAKEFATHLK